MVEELTDGSCLADYGKKIVEYGSEIVGCNHV